MTKKELLDALASWNDDTEIEISICPDADMKSLGESDRIWYELTNVEQPSINDDKAHCLLIGGLVTMC